MVSSEVKGCCGYLQDPLGEACLLGELLEVLGVWVVVDGEVGLHGPQLVVLEGCPHALGLLTGAVLGVPVHGLAVIFVTAQRCGPTGNRKKGWLVRGNSDPITNHHHFDLLSPLLLIGSGVFFLFLTPFLSQNSHDPSDQRVFDF